MDPYVAWCRMTMKIQTLVATNGPATSVQSISWSVGQKVCFLGRPVGSFGVSDDDQMISMADPWCWRRSTDIMPQKSDFKKITGANHYETRKESEKRTFRRKSGDPDFQGRRRPWTLVHFSVAFRSPFLGRFSGFFASVFSCIFLWHFSSFIGLIPLKKTRRKAVQIRAQSFLFFGKAEDSVADFPPRVETGSNDVGMTWNLRWSFLGIR